MSCLGYENYYSHFLMEYNYYPRTGWKYMNLLFLNHPKFSITTTQWTETSRLLTHSLSDASTQSPDEFLRLTVDTGRVLTATFMLNLCAFNSYYIEKKNYIIAFVLVVTLHFWWLERKKCGHGLARCTKSNKFRKQYFWPSRMGILRSHVKMWIYVLEGFHG